MCRTLLLALSLLMAQGSMIAASGQPASLPAPKASSKAAQAAAKPGPLAYAIASLNFNQFGVLDIGSGMFHPIADLPNPAQCIARNAQGQIYVADAKSNQFSRRPCS